VAVLDHALDHHARAGIATVGVQEVEPRAGVNGYAHVHVAEHSRGGSQRGYFVRGHVARYSYLWPIESRSGPSG
jgi:hypothetical protein